MKQKRVDLRKAVLRTGRDAAGLLAGILAGAVAAYGVAAPDDMHHPAQPTQAVMASGVATASTAALDIENLRAVAKALGIHASQEIGIYAAMARKVDDDFLAQVPWQLALQQVRQGERSWVQVLTNDEPQR